MRPTVEFDADLVVRDLDLGRKFQEILTVADDDTCHDEDPPSHLFHNMAHHPSVEMTLKDVARERNRATDAKEVGIGESR